MQSAFCAAQLPLIGDPIGAAQLSLNHGRCAAPTAIVDVRNAQRQPRSRAAPSAWLAGDALESRRRRFAARPVPRFDTHRPCMPWLPRAESGSADRSPKKSSSLKLRDWFEVVKRKEQELKDVAEVFLIDEGEGMRLQLEEEMFRLPPGELAAAITAMSQGVLGVMAYFQICDMQLQEYQEELKWAAEAEDRGDGDAAVVAVREKLAAMRARAAQLYARVETQQERLSGQLLERLGSMPEIAGGEGGAGGRKDVMDAAKEFVRRPPPDPRDAPVPSFFFASREMLEEQAAAGEGAEAEEEAGEEAGEEERPASPARPPSPARPASPSPQRLGPLPGGQKPLLAQETFLFWSKMSSNDIGDLNAFIQASLQRREVAAAFVPVASAALFVALKARTFAFGGEEAIDAAILAGETWTSGWLPWLLWSFGIWVASYPLTLVYGALSVPWRPEDGRPSLLGIREILVNRRRLLEEGPDAFPIKTGPGFIIYDIVKFLSGGGEKGEDGDGGGPPSPGPRSPGPRSRTPGPSGSRRPEAPGDEAGGGGGGKA
eukprot:tig00000792_g4199.t1